MTCSNCRYSRPAKAEGVVGCAILNGLVPADKPLQPQDVTGAVYEGWFTSGVMLMRGVVVDKTGSCEFEESKVIL